MEKNLEISTPKKITLKVFGLSSWGISIIDKMTHRENVEFFAIDTDLLTSLIKEKIFIDAHLLIRVINEKNFPGLSLKIFAFQLPLNGFEVLRINGYFHENELLSLPLSVLEG